MACPAGAGASALVIDWWRKDNEGISPSPAMVKAVLINTAQDLGRIEGSDYIPSNSQGWGRIYFGDLFDEDFHFTSIDQNVLLSNTGEETELYIKTNDSEKPLKVTLVWTDCPGAPFANPALVNDLDLIVENNDFIYFGNNFSSGWSEPGNFRDNLNNIENVYIQTPAVISKIKIRASNIAGDGVPDVLGFDQDFALFISNADILSSKGVISFDRNNYNCNDEIKISLNDSDLKGSGSINVRVINIDKNNEKFVDLQEIDSKGVFQGFLNTSTEQNGALGVSHNSIIKVEYIDADDGLGGIDIPTFDTALIDCEGPEIIDIDFFEIGSKNAKVKIKTDENCDVVMSYWLNGGEEFSISSNFEKEHIFEIINLDSCSDYYLKFFLKDILSNTRIADNDGSFFSFRTLRNFEEFFDDSESGEKYFEHLDFGSGEDLWHISSKNSYSGENSWFCANENGWYENNLNNVLVSEVVSVIDGTKLSFWTRYAIEEDWDFGYIEIKSTEDTSWDNLTPGGEITGYQENWELIEIPLTGYEGDVQIRFRFSSDGDEIREGWYIDDIEMSSLRSCSFGALNFDKEIYGCSSASVNLKLEDDDLNLTSESKDSYDLVISSQITGDSKSVELIETDNSSGVFLGHLTVTNNENGNGFELLVEDKDTIIASYVDEDDGTGNSRDVTSEAQTDCSQPVISDVKVLEITGDNAIIIWNTNKPSISEINYGKKFNFEDVVVDGFFREIHVMMLENLESCLFINFKILSEPLSIFSRFILLMN